MRNITINKLSFLVVLLTIQGVQQWCRISLGSTAIWWIIDILLLLVLFSLKPKKYNIGIISLYFVMLVASSVYGAAFQVENYWDWKQLINNMLVFSIPLAAYSFARPRVLSYTLKAFIIVSPILVIFLCVFCGCDAYGRLLVPYSFIILFLRYLDKETAILSLAAFSIVFVLGFNSRSDLLKYFFALCLGLGMVFPMTKKFLSLIVRPLQLILFVLPLILLLFAALGTFNIFTLGEKNGLNEKYMINDSQYASGESSMFSDTRTFIYEEEIISSINNKYYIWGRSIARGYDSDFFGYQSDMDLNLNRGERGGSEVGIMNVYNYFGLIGVIILALIYFIASYMALYKSQNTFVPIVGIFLSFRWVLLWIEDDQRFDMNNLFIWIIIGFCFSPWFRRMSDDMIASWVRSFGLGQRRRNVMENQ